MFRKQNGRQRRNGRRSAATGTRDARLRTRLSYANVTASLALFVALGGTAAAAVTLPRDSVGSPQIRTDAVRSPEIAKNAVRSPEIAKDAVGSPEIKAEAVRSSEIQDGGVRLADISDGARSALQGAQGPAGPQGPSGTTNVRIAEAESVQVPTCLKFVIDDLTDCENLLSVRALPPGNWLVQAKLTVVPNGPVFGNLRGCGLVQGPVSNDATLLDHDSFAALLDDSDEFVPAKVTLADVVTTTNAATTIGVRCLEEPTRSLSVEDVKLTALEVANVVGP